MTTTDLLTIGEARARLIAPAPAAPNALPSILSLATASPAGRYAQRDIYNALARLWPTYRNSRIEHFFMDGDIEYRNLCLDLAGFSGNESLDQMRARFIEGAVSMGRDAIRSALRDAAVAPAEVDFLVTATCTGYVCPGLGSLYAKEFGFPKTLQRAELVGMGCAGAMPAMQRAYDFVRSNPGKTALVVAVEVCSACYYLDDSPETIVGNAICADGAAAMVVGTRDGEPGEEWYGPEADALPRIVGFRTLHDTSFIDKVGFDQKEGRLRIVLSKDLRESAGAMVRSVADGLLDEFGLERRDIEHWILHPGGRKIIDAVQAGLGLSDWQVRHSKSVLRNFGNMSSPTVLFVLGRTARPRALSERPRAGELGMMIAMGPGLAIEGALVQW